MTARFRRLVDRVARPYFADLHVRITHLDEELAATREDLGRALAALQAITDDETGNRRRLHALRRDPSYELAFKERDPLVSFVIPTYDRHTSLRDVALPSILGQSYPNLEVVVIGDGSPLETAEAIAEIDDPRVTFFNRPYRGPYSEIEHERWLASGTPAFNEGLSRATGRWIAPMADDDAVRPDHTRTLVDAAQAHGYEACYGNVAIHFEDGRQCELGEFPPRPGAMAMQGTIFHSGLRFIHSELIDATFGNANDWSRTRKMMRAGVYIGMVDEVVTDKHETRHRIDHFLWMGARATS